MKTISVGLKSHLATEVTTLCACWRIVRTDGAVYAFTTHDADLVVSGVTYLSTAGFTASAIQTGSTGEVDNLEAHGFLSSIGLDVQDLQNGLFNYASVYVFGVNWSDLTQGILRLRRGWLGEVSRRSDGSFVAELRGLTQGLTQEFGNVYTPYCRADLGDAQCKVPLIASYRQTATVATAIDQHAFISTPLTLLGGETGDTADIAIRNNITANTALEISDGVHGPVSIVFPFEVSGATATATIISNLEANIGSGALAMSIVPRTLGVALTNLSGAQANISKTGDAADPSGILITQFDAGYLDNGLITWITGQNAGASFEIKTYAASGSIIYLWLGLNYAAAEGDTFYYTPGCDKRRDTCVNKYNNILNFRGEPDMPGLDAMLAYPDA